MKGYPSKEIKVIDGKECNMLWLEYGTLARVQNILTIRGVRSPRSGKEISRSAIAMSVWRWCCVHPDESWEIEKKARATKGITLTKDDWDVELIIHARNAYTAIGYRKWLKRNNFEEIARQNV